MIAKEYYDLGMERLKTFDPAGLLPALRYANDGAIEDVLNVNGSANYQWGACLMETMRPKQVVELGGAMGVWSLCILHNLPKTSKLYSITLAEEGLEFSYVKDKYENFYPIVGDDLNMDNWKDIDLHSTDVWYFDTGIADDHFGEHLEKEMALYSPYFKKGALIIFDDIHKSDRMDEAWEKIKSGQWGDLDCYDATDPLHWTGYGLAVKK